MSSISLRGKVSSEGYPPANEYISSSFTLLKISLTGELIKEAVSKEKNLP